MKGKIIASAVLGLSITSCGIFEGKKASRTSTSKLPQCSEQLISAYEAAAQSLDEVVAFGNNAYGDVSPEDLHAKVEVFKAKREEVSEKFGKEKKCKAKGKDGKWKEFNLAQWLKDSEKTVRSLEGKVGYY